MERESFMNKKTKFLLAHPKIYNIYALFKVFLYKAGGIGKSGNCVMCGFCKNKGCMKNRIAQTFRMAKVFEVKCYAPIENNNETTEQ